MEVAVSHREKVTLESERLFKGKTVETRESELVSWAVGDRVLLCNVMELREGGG